MVRLVPQSHSSALNSVPLHSGKREGRKTQEDPAATVLVVTSGARKVCPYNVLSCVVI
jgi:hypothetical protein